MPTAATYLVDVEVYNEVGDYSTTYKMRPDDFEVQVERIIRRIHGSSAASNRQADQWSEDESEVCWRGVVVVRGISISRAVEPL